MMDPEPRDSNKPGRPDDLSASTYAGLGIQFAVGIFLFLYLGKWIDSTLGTSPIGVIAGVFFGAAGSFYIVYRKIVAAQRRDDEIHGRKNS
jgi:F0F1-type ATP synthase assembly protein I